MLRLLTDPLLSILYPQQCKLCSSVVDKHGDGVVCDDCWLTAEIFTGLETLCTKCGAFLSRAEPLFETYCHKCDDHFYDTARAVGTYKGPIAETILSLKREPFLPARIVDLLVDMFTEHFQTATTLIVPVPLSRKRLHERGFNQAESIACKISKRASVPTDTRSLARRFHTGTHRAGMDAKAREMSVKNAFEVKRPRLIEGQSILLVDDVLTSGATASSCAKALKNKGAAKVNVLTIGRAV